MPIVELSFSALPGHVRTARLISAVVARRAGITESLLDEVRLAVGEACTRAVDLHRQFCPQTPVQVTLSHDDRYFEVLVRDAAPSEGTLDDGALETLEQEAAAAAGGPAAPGSSAAPGPAGAQAGAGRAPAGTSRGAAHGTGHGMAHGMAHDALPAPESAFQPLPPGVGLAVIGGIVDEVDVEADEHGARVRMRWPVPAHR